MKCERCGAEVEHPGFVHMPDHEVTAARHALGLLQSMVQDRGSAVDSALEAKIDASLRSLVPYDSKRPAPQQPAMDLLRDVVMDYGDQCDDHDDCGCSMARAARLVGGGGRD